MTDLHKEKFLMNVDGVVREVFLEVTEPLPTKIHPKRTGIVISLRLLLTEADKDIPNHPRHFRQILDPRIKVNRELCHVTPCIDISGDSDWFEFVYFVFDYAYGLELYDALCDNLSKRAI